LQYALQNLQRDMQVIQFPAGRLSAGYVLRPAIPAGKGIREKLFFPLPKFS
jgi:hypothetical protein